MTPSGFSVRPAVPADTTALVEFNRAIRRGLQEAMRLASGRLQQRIARDLTGDTRGAETLLALIRERHASPRLLRRPGLRERLLSALPGASREVEALTADLPSEKETARQLMAARFLGYSRATPSVARGLSVFEKNCAACHQVSGKGTVVGPQLDGIGGRGLERLLEDILDSNRNVDVAFRVDLGACAHGQNDQGMGLAIAQATGEDLARKRIAGGKVNAAPVDPSDLNLARVNPGLNVPIEPGARARGQVGRRVFRQLVSGIAQEPGEVGFRDIQKRSIRDGQLLGAHTASRNWRDSTGIN